MRKVKLLKLGVTPYQRARDLQIRIRDMVKQGFSDGVLIILQHPPVYTVGISGGFDNILIPVDELKKKAEIYRVERGGNITFHGPGQIVAYPIFNLRKWEKDVHLYVYRLEEVVIQLLADYGIKAGRKEKYRGVWVGDEKICAIGAAITQWITWHGIAFNVNTDLNYFKFINPCGITEYGVTSLEKLGIREDVKSVSDKMVGKFKQVFDMEVEEIGLNDLGEEV
ncbi:lipoyl(octanoyl) transferase LipB [Thermoanaerobacterium sp. DL9XJH110]|uniref:lipoyl(octanoyl) transferase LipB n=1 Tax=Thermoanaerobacterium sp. DL9XJH110 TaxID=3386643 RepID=UPI003BB5D87D